MDICRSSPPDTTKLRSLYILTKMFLRPVVLLTHSNNPHSSLSGVTVCMNKYCQLRRVRFVFKRRPTIWATAMSISEKYEKLMLKTSLLLYSHKFWCADLCVVPLDLCANICWRWSWIPWDVRLSSSHRLVCTSWCTACHHCHWTWFSSVFATTTTLRPTKRTIVFFLYRTPTANRSKSRKENELFLWSATSPRQVTKKIKTSFFFFFFFAYFTGRTKRNTFGQMKSWASKSMTASTREKLSTWVNVCKQEICLWQSTNRVLNVADVDLLHWKRIVFAWQTLACGQSDRHQRLQRDQYFAEIPVENS